MKNTTRKKAGKEEKFVSDFREKQGLFHICSEK